MRYRATTRRDARLLPRAFGIRRRRDPQEFAWLAATSTQVEDVLLSRRISTKFPLLVQRGFDGRQAAKLRRRISVGAPHGTVAEGRERRVGNGFGPERELPGCVDPM